jgi:hypothetical protein
MNRDKDQQLVNGLLSDGLTPLCSAVMKHDYEMA